MGVYVPAFATAGIDGMSVCVIVLLILIAVWIAAGRSSPPAP
ncbi:hypothetical protein NKG94_13620 [Micromonospora sp. M12]